MAIDFDGTGDWLKITTTSILTAPPLTMACWFNPDDVTVNRCLISLDDVSGGFNQMSLQISGAVAGDPVRCTTQNFVTVANADTTSGYSASSWQHACGVIASATDRRAFLNGASKGTNATSVTDPPGLDAFSIGDLGVADTLPMAGLIAHAALYNIALSDAEVAILALGAHPMQVRPEALVFYLPMFDAHAGQVDWVGGRSLTVNGNPTQAASDPRIGLPPWQLVGAGAKKVTTARTVAAAAGAYDMTGTTAALKLGRLVSAGVGAYAMTGMAAALKLGRLVAAGIGSYSMSGQTAALKIGRLVSAGIGSYSMSGQDAALTRGGRSVAADSGSYAKTGTAATLKLGRLVAAGIGSYTMMGSDATLSISGAAAGGGTRHMRQMRSTHRKTRKRC